MPRVNGRRDDPMMVAIEDGSLTGPDGSQYPIRVGMRLRASRPAVKIAPHLFRPWAETDDLDIAEARQALLVRAGVLAG
jgi:hypothetical protein